MTNATSTPEAGQVLAGKYLVEQVLGVGGMGVVVAAKHLQLDQRVAIKYLLPAALQSPEVVERFAREARAAAKIRGEHVARVIDVGQFDDGAPFMVLEYLDGFDLAKELEERGPLRVEDAIRWILETCEALAEAHAAKIVHRDLKPSNLFLARQPDKRVIVKVLDFGISKTGDAPSASLTRTSALMGTAFYMSPEQLTTPKAVDHRSDIWSLGVILYELLSGRQPFLGETVAEIIGGILQNEPEPLRNLRTDVAPELEAVIAKCMQSKAAQRYPDVAALAAALGPFARPEDRGSIDSAARVLGVTLDSAPLAPSNSTLLLASANVVSSSQVTASSAQARPPAPALNAPATSPLASTGSSPPASVPGVGVPAVTTHALAASSISPKPKQGFVAVVAVALLCTTAGGAAVAYSFANKKPDVSPVSTAGIVSKAATAESLPLAPAATAPIVPTAPLVVTAPEATGSASANASASGTPAIEPAGTGVAQPGGRTPTKPTTPRASASVAAAPHVPTPPASSGSSTTSPKNPLQMGIK